MSRFGGFVIGQWVSGPKFYGREAEIAALLGGPARWQWIAGLRRIGKTSLLKQLDHLAGADVWNTRRLPLFWDLQGVGDVEELGLTFAEALLDAEELLAERGIALEEIEDPDAFAAMAKLARALRSRGVELLLLCDEADELMPLSRAVPGLAARLWQALAGFEPARVVLASSLRLCDLGTGENGVEGLAERFAAPRYLGAMTDADARALLRQGSFAAADVEAIRAACGNHPMLLQIVAKRFQEIGDLEETFSQVAADHAVQHLFAVDFELLLPAEREALSALPPWTASGASGQRLLQLGLTLPNRFLASWLAERSP
jgi:hypothetical protein